VLTVRLACLVLIAAVAGWYAGCTRHQARQADIFVYNEPSGIASLDPAQASYQSAWWAGQQLYSGLVDFDTALQIIPALAKWWSSDSTLRRWRFVLRNDVWFHEAPCFGQQRTRRCTAEDVRYSIERILDARTRSPGLWVFLNRIRGARAFHDATRRGERPAHCEGIKVPNDTTIEFELVEPFAPFLQLLAMPYAWVVPREAVAYYGDRFGEHPVGTGPFRLGWWKPDRELVLVRNERYWRFDEHGTRLPYLRAVRIEFVRDQRTEFAEFRRGRYAMLASLDPAFAHVLLNEQGQLTSEYAGKYRLLSAPALSTEYYGILLDTTLPAGRQNQLARSRLLRQALNYAIDRERMVRYVLRGMAYPARGVLPPPLAGYSGACYQYDRQRARMLLAQAGYPEGQGLPLLRLVISTSSRTLSIAEAVQEQWAELGVRVELQQVDFPRLLSMVRNGEVALWRTSWIADYPDAENFFALFHSANLAPRGPNTTRYRNTAADDLYRRAQAAADPAQRSQLYGLLEQQVVGDAPWVFLFHGRIVRLVQAFVEGLTVDPLDRLVLERVRIAPSH